MRKFPKDCPPHCPHLKSWDMSIDDYTCYCKKLQMQIDDCDDFWCPSCPVSDDELEGICKAITAEPFASLRNFACEFDKSIARCLKSILGAVQHMFSHAADAFRLLFDRSGAMQTINRRKLSKAERFSIYNTMDGHCAYCGLSIKYEEMQVDHVVPLNGWSEQGEDTIDNMLPACRRCNAYKSRSTLEGFRKMLEHMPDVLMRDSTTYRNAVRYGLVKPKPHKVVFYFEKLKERVK